MSSTDQQLQEAADLFIEDVTPVTAAAGSSVAPITRVPQGRQVSRTKIVFDDSSEDEEEREKRWAQAMPQTAVAEGLSTDAADYEDPVEMVKLCGLDSDDEARLEEDGVPAGRNLNKRKANKRKLPANMMGGLEGNGLVNGDAEVSSSDIDEKDFFEDVPAVANTNTTSAPAPAAVKAHTVQIPEGYTMEVPGLRLGAAQVRNYVKRVHRPGEASLDEAERQKRDRDDLEESGGVELGEEDQEEKAATDTEWKPRPIDPTMVKTVFGYNLSLDPRDLEEFPGRKPGPVPTQVVRGKRDRDLEAAKLVVDPALLPSDDDEADKEGVTTTTAGGGDERTCFRCGKTGHMIRDCPQDQFEDEEEELDEEEEELEAEIDDLALVASIEQLVAGCEGDPSQERYVEFKAFAKQQQEKLWSKEISVQEFAIAMLPAVSKVRGAVKEALRPPKPGPIIIDGVKMDI